VTDAPLVIGTAGHVDHGKTSLVKALTGVDLDRLPEEKERGITISLGFTPLTLPSGRVAGLVDVPGHERLVRTMIAGASGMDAVMLCVSAVEGVMPQTREHLDVLGLLGVKTGLVVLTMADLVDPELLELAAEEARDQVKGSFLQDAPVLPVSSVTGQGLDALRAALDAIMPPPRPLDRAFRLPVDRAFARRGFGTVVTGTVWAGRLTDGTEVEILPGGRRVRVRGIQVHGKARAEALPGARTALNLAGVEVEEVGRGSWVVAPGAVPAARVVDASYHHLPDAPAWEGEAHVLVLHGTREVDARMVRLDGEGVEAGADALVQLRLAEVLPCLPGDPFVVRLASPSRTVGGGRVIDPWSAVARRSKAVEALPILRRLAAGDLDAWLTRAGAGGMPEADLQARTGGLRGVRLGERRFEAAVLDAHRAALLAALDAAHAAAPLTPAVNRKSLRTGTLLALGEREFLALIDQEVARGTILADSRGVRRPGFAPTLNPAQAAWRETALAALREARWEGTEKLRELAPDPQYDALLHLLKDRGEAEQVGDRLWGREALDELATAVRAWFQSHDRLDPAAFKELTGLSRRSAIPLLEWLDAKGVTRRVGDERVRA